MLLSQDIVLFYRLVISFFLTCFLYSSVLFGAELYGAIEIGGKGIKTYIFEQEGKELSLKYRDSINASVQQGIENRHMKQEMIDTTGMHIFNAYQKLRQEYAIIDSHIFIVASSAINKIDNKPSLKNYIFDLTRHVLYFIDEQEESTYGFYGAVPASQWSNALMMDIGGGNTKLAWLGTKDSIEFLEIPLGTVSLTQAIEDLNSKELFQKKASIIIQSELPKLKVIPEKKVLYTSGGIFWATAYLKTKGQLNTFTPLDTSDFQTLIRQFIPINDTPCNDTTTPSCYLLQFYGAHNLIAGAILADTIIQTSHFDSKSIYFSKDGIWMIGWLRKNLY